MHALVYLSIEFLALVVEIAGQGSGYDEKGDGYYENGDKDRENEHYVEIGPVGTGIAYVVVAVAFIAQILPDSHDYNLSWSCKSLRENTSFNDNF